MEAEDHASESGFAASGPILVPLGTTDRGGLGRCSGRAEGGHASAINERRASPLSSASAPSFFKKMNTCFSSTMTRLAHLTFIRG